MRRTLAALAGTAALCTLAACSGARVGAPVALGRTPHEHNRLTEADLLQVSNAPSLHAAIERLRPRYLRPRATHEALGSARPSVAVYIDGHYAGDTQMLRSLMVHQVTDIRFLQPAEAYATMGPSMRGDAVLMISLRKPQ